MTLSTALADTPNTEILTNARLSLWDAIDNYSELATKPYRIVKAYRLSDEQAGMRDIVPSVSDLPALAIIPKTLSPVWYQHKMQKWPYVVDCLLWTKDWAHSFAENMTVRLLDAFGKSLYSPDLSYVKRATGYYPLRFGPVSYAPVRLGDANGPKVIRTTIQVTLRLAHDPLH